MKLHCLWAGLGLAMVSGLASASVSLDAGPYTVTYDPGTPGFGSIASWSSGPGGAVSFEWHVSNAVQVSSTGQGLVTAVFELPSFTLTANPGYALSGNLTGSLGNLSFFELGPQAHTGASAGATVSINGGPGVVVPLTALSQVVSPASPNGYFADARTWVLGGFTSVSLTAASLSLSADASLGSFAAIVGQPQNTLKFSFTANPVPEPQTAWLWGVGLGLMAWLRRRRPA